MCVTYLLEDGDEIILVGCKPAIIMAFNCFESLTAKSLTAIESQWASYLVSCVYGLSFPANAGFVNIQGQRCLCSCSHTSCNVRLSLPGLAWRCQGGESTTGAALQQPTLHNRQHRS